MSFLGINRQGLPFVLGPAALAAVLGHFRRKRSALWALGFAGACAYFFRDPDRYPPYDRELVVSPADGKIISIRRLAEDEWLNTDVYQISIFMSLFDVHVNRAPVSGKIIEIIHKPGCFLPANRSEAAKENERCLYLMERLDGLRLLTVQVAGLIARRTVPFVQPGEEVLAGERIGMIRFGSRLEVLVPAEDSKILVNIGHRVKAGETPLLWHPWRVQNG